MLTRGRGLHRTRAEHGAAAVEFAIVSTVLFLVLFGIIQWAIAFNRAQGLQAGAREGARLAALPETDLNQTLTRVRNSVSIVDGSALSLGCPGNLDALALDTGCVQVARRAPGGAVTTLAGGTTRPCDRRPDASVIVTVAYRTAIEIPLWKSTERTLVGEGEFACEA